MKEVWIPHDSWILVGDGRKALLLRNAGTPQRPSLEVLDMLRDGANPPTQAQGTERPGRVMQSLTGRRSAVEQTDWHKIAEKNFAREIAAKLDAAAKAGNFKQLVLVAPPRTLAELRTHLGAEAKKRVIAEVGKDLTKHPVSEIVRLLADG
jgi:protein required for attachment to host cells